MTKEELNKQLIAIEHEMHGKKMAILRDYAFSNNTINAGDIICDHIGLIKVEAIGIDINLSTNNAEYRYYGNELKKDLTPRKNGNKRYAYQSNLNK